MKVTKKQFVSIPAITVGCNVTKEAETKEEAKELGYNSTIYEEDYADFYLGDLLEYVKDRWFRFMYKGDIRDMIKEEPTLITDDIS